MNDLYGRFFLMYNEGGCQILQAFDNSLENSTLLIYTELLSISISQVTNHFSLIVIIFYILYFEIWLLVGFPAILLDSNLLPKGALWD